MINQGAVDAVAQAVPHGIRKRRWGCWRWGHLTQHGSDNDQFYDEQDAYNNAELALYDVIRLDLGLEGIIQPDGRPLPGSGWTTELPDPDEATTSNNPVSR